MNRPNEFDPRFSKAEKEAQQVITYDDLIRDHEQVINNDLEFADQIDDILSEIG